MLPSIVEEERLSTSFALVIAGAKAYRIYMAPIVLTLRVTLWITMHFTGRGLKDPRRPPQTPPPVAESKSPTWQRRDGWMITRGGCLWQGERRILSTAS